MWLISAIIFTLLNLYVIAESPHSCPAMIIPTYDDGECPDIPRHYEELKCESDCDADGECVSSFECPSCDTEPEPRTGPDCRLVKCAGPPSPDCAFYYESLDSCCAKYINCDPKNPDEDLPYCYVNGKEYRGGERITIEGECLQCLCTQCFNNNSITTDNKACAKPKCYIEKEMFCKGCVPIYCGTVNCCPVNWRCNDENDFVIKKEGKRNKSKKCVFGNLTLYPGDQLNVINDGLDVQCTCSMPPYVTCIQKQGC